MPNIAGLAHRLSRLVASRNPVGSANATAMSNANPVSSSVTGSAVASSFVTGWWLRTDSPRFPCTVSFSQ